MKRALFLPTACLFLAFGTLAPAEERPAWDQTKAEAKVKAMITQENRGDFAWDKIRWLTDADAAVKLAQKEKKPLFVYMFLKRDVGPAAAPC